MQASAGGENHQSLRRNELIGIVMKEQLKAIWKRIKIFLLVVFLLAIGVLSYILTGHSSEGYRGGTLIKVSKRGIIFKTLEGQLNIGTFIDNGRDKPFSPIWDFSVKDEPALFESLNNAILTNARVKLHYKEKFVKLPWRGDTKYIVDEVEVIH